MTLAGTEAGPSEVAGLSQSSRRQQGKVVAACLSFEEKSSLTSSLQ